MQSGRDVGRAGDAIARRCLRQKRHNCARRKSFFGRRKTCCDKGNSSAHAIWTPQQHGTTNWPRKFFLR
jgi:hypothetical protein